MRISDWSSDVCSSDLLFNGSSGPAEYRTPRGEIMSIRYIAIAAAALVTRAIPAAADPGDQWAKQWEKRAECDKKLYEAKSRKDFYQKDNECNRELAKMDRAQRKEAEKAWREREKKWREPFQERKRVGEGKSGEGR